ncbi:MAG: response regulator transcription factor [Verrucomicrobia bacterium]|nr:response regulator transcription factor [Verrucomicrobiota bacterium]
MIADDNREWRDFLHVMLGTDYSIIDCQDGEETIAAYEHESPDWVLMDIAMAPVDGLTAASTIKRRHPDARIIFVTQHTERVIREQATRLGAVAFIPKDEAWRILEIIRSKPGAG